MRKKSTKKKTDELKRMKCERRLCESGQVGIYAKLF